MSLIQSYNYIKKIKELSGRNDKEALFREALKNEEFKQVAIFALHPHLQFHMLSISFIHESTRDTRDTRDTKTCLFKHLDKLSKQTGANYNDRNRLTVLASVDAETYHVVSCIIKKDLDCGIGTKSAAKYIEEIEEYPVMLCTAQSEKAIEFLNYEKGVYSDLKEDGGYISIEVVDVSVEYKSRDGRVIWIDKHKDSFADMADKTGHDQVFIGEALFTDSDGEFLSRKKSNGILNKAIKGTISNIEIERMHIRLWDMVKYSDFVKKYSPVPLNGRRADLCYALSKIKNNNIAHCDFLMLHSIEESDAHFAKVYNSGSEGTIEKQCDAPWEAKRSKWFVKRKGEHDCDLEIIGYTKHKKDPDLIGSLLCQSSDHMLRVSVGSGLNDKTRSLPFSFFDGKIAEIKFNEIITSESKSTHSLFLPRFEDKGDIDWLRNDKIDAHSLDEIIVISKEKKKSKN